MSTPFEPTQYVPAVGSGRQDPPRAGDDTDLLDDFDDEDLEDELPATRYHVGLDFGLLVLRIAVGGTMLLYGLHKFGMFGGPGLNEMPQAIEAAGFTSQTKLLAWALAIGQVGGGGLLLIGLLTPIAAAAVLSITATGTYLARDIGYFPAWAAENLQTPGYAFPLMVGAGALALLFTGPGRISLDVAFPWRKRPLAYGFIGILLAAAAVVLVLTVFR